MIAIVQNIVVLLIVASVVAFFYFFPKYVSGLVRKGTELVKDVVINTADAVMQFRGASFTTRHKVCVKISSFISLSVLTLKKVYALAVLFIFVFALATNAMTSF